MPDLNFNATLSVNTNDQNSLDEIAYKPVIGIKRALFGSIFIFNKTKKKCLFKIK